MTGRKSPVRDYAAEFLKAGLNTQQAVSLGTVLSAIAANPATGAVFGDVVGALLGPLAVVGIHGNTLTRVLTADVDNYDSGDNAFIQRIDFAGFALNGIVAPDSPGEVRIYVAVTGGTIANEAGSSTDVNRVLTGTGADLTLADDASVIMVYDGESTRWRIVGGTGGGGGGTTDTSTQLYLAHQLR